MAEIKTVVHVHETQVRERDMTKQHEIHCKIAATIISSSLRTVLGENLGSIKKAHEMAETSRPRGKVALAGF